VIVIGATEGRGRWIFDCASVLARVQAKPAAPVALQLVRAASSVALNIAGSANETLAALRVAVAWGYVATSDAEAGAALLRRIIPML
jgi:hypothetical protein